jgi:cell wall-associated NlpC family hydrolase
MSLRARQDSVAARATPRAVRPMRRVSIVFASPLHTCCFFFGKDRKILITFINNFFHPMFKISLLCAIALLLAACAGPPMLDEAAPVTNLEASTTKPLAAPAERPVLADDPTANSASSNERRARILAHHANWRGTPHRWGGQSQRGVDCSGYMVQTFRVVFGHALPRTTLAQATLGHSVGREQLQDGDLVFFKTGRSQRHVGVYVGNGQFAHASRSRGVAISSLDNVYWKRRYWQSRRLL